MSKTQTRTLFRAVQGPLIVALLIVAGMASLSCRRSAPAPATGVLTPADFSEELRQKGPRSAVFSETLIPLGEMERQYAEHVVSQVDGNMTRAAEVLEIDRRTLYRLLERPAKKPDEHGH